MQEKTQKKVVTVPKSGDEARLRVRMWDERKGESAREREKEIQLFFHFTSCKKPFSSHSKRAEGKLGKLCDSWWNFVQLLLVSQHNLLNHFRGSLNRLRRFFPVCDTRKIKKKREREGEKLCKNFVIFATIISPRDICTKTEFLKIFGYTP